MKSDKKVIITAALAGAGTFKNNNPNVPYTPQEFADEAEKAYKAGAAMVHVHGRRDDGWATVETDRVRATHDAIKERVPELIVNLSTGAPDATPEERIEQIIQIKPEMASLNTNTMNFAIMDRKAGTIFLDTVFTNTFTMLQDFGKAMEENQVKPEFELYDFGGLDNVLLIGKQGIFTDPLNFNFVWGVAGGQGIENGGLAGLGRADDGEVHATPPFTAPRVRASSARGQGRIILGVYMTAERALPQLEADKLRDELNRFSGSVRIVTFLSPT